MLILVKKAIANATAPVALARLASTRETYGVRRLQPELASEGFVAGSDMERFSPISAPVQDQVLGDSTNCPLTTSKTDPLEGGRSRCENRRMCPQCCGCMSWVGGRSGLPLSLV